MSDREAMSEQHVDILISRVIDGRSSDAEWAELEAAAGKNPDVWRDLALAQRDDRALRGAVEEATRPHETADLSAEELHAAAVRRSAHTLSDRARLVATWGGWVAAAGIAIAVAGQHQVASPAGVPGVQSASGPLSLGSAADALNAYLAKGKQEGLVQGQLPDKKLLNVTPLPDGKGYEVTYLRQIVEKARIDNLYRPTPVIDEFGRSLSVPVEVKPQIVPTAY
ncbi:MAG: hypothetical protein GC200_06045 [Tepidisphaera sp.]|nr:hypothetical protein [Tepidisphaera sp.]